MRGREARGTLLWVLDKTETSMGKRLLRSWIEQPLVDAEAINARLCAVQALLHRQHGPRRFERGTRPCVRHRAPDHPHFVRLCHPARGQGTGGHLRHAAAGQGTAACGAPLLVQLADQIDLLEDVLQNIRTALVDDPPANMKDGGAIRAGFNSEVDELRDHARRQGYLST